MSEDFESQWAKYDSGPFCKHWGDPGSCVECAGDTLVESGSVYLLTNQQLATLYQLVKEEIDKRGKTTDADRPTS